MHQSDVKSASVHHGRFLSTQPTADGSAEMGAQTLPSPTIQSFSTTPGQSLGERVGGEGEGRERPLGEADGDGSVLIE